MSTHSTDTDPRKTEVELVLHVLGTDPWMRFDLWAGRAWDALERAMQLSMEAGQVQIDEQYMDPRVITLFNAASFAKDFANMVSPIAAVEGIGDSPFSHNIADSLTVEAFDPEESD